MQAIIRPLARLLPLALLALPLALGAPLPAARADPTASTTIFLPLVSAGGAAPDLIFTPDSVSLAPGERTDIQVRVEPQADLTGASFELPGVQDGVTSSFEAAADGATGTLTNGRYAKQLVSGNSPNANGKNFALALDTKIQL